MALGRTKNKDNTWINESKHPWGNQTVLRRAAQSSTDSTLVAVAQFSAVGQSLTSLLNKKSHSRQNIAPPLIGMLCKMLFWS